MALRRIVAWALVFLLFGGQALADRSEAEKQARRSFERAQVHFKAGLFAKALAEYQEGYQQLPLPGFLINIAQCQRRLGHLVQARAAYRRFIFIQPDSPYVPEVKSLVAELDALIEVSESLGSPPPRAGESMSNVSMVPQMLDERSAASPAAVNTLVTEPATEVTPPSRGSRWWLWGSMGAAVLMGAVAAVLLLRTPETTTIHEGSLATLGW
jgi:tetratricopeptide (TPR) repeat protein